MVIGPIAVRAYLLFIDPELSSVKFGQLIRVCHDAFSSIRLPDHNCAREAFVLSILLLNVPCTSSLSQLDGVHSKNHDHKT